MGPMISGEEDNNNTAVNSAAEDNSESMAKRLVEAVKNDDLASLKELLGKGANPDTKNDYGEPALHLVRSRRAAQLLLDARADVNAPDEIGERALHKLARYGPATAVELLVASGADSSAEDDYSKTPLHCAATSDEGGEEGPEAIYHILEAGADPDVSDDDNRTPLHEAVRYMDPRGAQALLKAGADPNTRIREEGYAPVHLALSPAVVKFLSESGADLDARDYNGMTALCELAAYSGREHLDVMRALLENGADPNQANNDGQTPLHLVAENSNSDGVSDITELLIAYDADPTRTDGTSAERTPLEIAKLHGNEPVVTVLQSA